MWITEKSSESYAKRQAGGKGYHLYCLTREGFPVPPWIVLAASYMERFKTETAAGSSISRILDSVQPTPSLPRAPSPEELERASQQIEKVFLEIPFPSAIEKDIREAYGWFGLKLKRFEAFKLAVRSSGLDEDSAQHSFAGQLSTFLFVASEQECMESVKKCWASGYSARSLSYRLQQGMSLIQPIQVAVVLQQMIPSEKSGVVFTCDPIHRNAEVLTINSVYGVGEGLVSGLLDADTVTVDKATGKILSEDIVVKKTQLVSASQRGTEEKEVPFPLQGNPVLSASEIQQLSELCLRIEKYYRFPQDIEWAWEGGKFSILQARPVTTEVRAQEGYLNLWDNSNIVESYGGLTAPLTFTFARFVYHQVYVQFCEILLVPQREIKNMDYFLRNMLGLFYGRVYYNLLNWYKLTSILPGFKYNRSFMETMMGTGESLSNEIADRIKPPGFQEKFSSKVRRFITGLKFLYFHFAIQSIVDRFLKTFHRIYDEYRKRPYSRMPADEIFACYQELERRLLTQWKAPIINDYLCMVHFGLFKKLTQSWLKDLGDSLQNDLLCGDGNLESAEPTRELIRLAGVVETNPGLKQLLLNCSPEDAYEALNQSPFQEFFTRINSYIDRFGFRCMSEMKLEQKDLHQDPSFLFVCLKNYLRSGQIDLQEYELRERKIRESAEKKVAGALSGWKKSVYAWSLRNARKAVRNRENTRFCRTRIYGVVRSMFFGIGRDYALRGIIEKPEDIFYITLPELMGSLEGTLTVQNLKGLVELRRQEYIRYEAIEPSARFMTRGPVYWLNDHSPALKDAEGVADEILPAHMLKGIGCCPGVVEGRVKVILSPEDNLELNGEILVTHRTDPGWIPLYPSVSGLLVERGGLLSHSAIVAREMGLPTIVGVRGVTDRLKPGMRIRMDGETGKIEILESLEGEELSRAPQNPQPSAEVHL